jgi:hypothetical protein
MDFPSAYFAPVLEEAPSASDHVSVFLMSQASALRSNYSEQDAARIAFSDLRDAVLNDPSIKGRKAKVLSRALAELAGMT